MSVTLSLEPATKSSSEVKSASGPFLRVLGADQTNHSENAGPTVPTLMQCPSSDAATLLSEAEDLLARAAAADSDQESPRLSNVLSPRETSVATPESSTPTSTRSGRKPTVLPLPLRSVDGGAGDGSKVSTQATDNSAAAAVVAAPPSSSPALSQPISVVRKTSLPTPENASPAVILHTGNTSSESYRTPRQSCGAVITASGVPTIPMLQLPIKECKDEVTPVKTLYSRLFREAQQREERLAQALRKQRIAQRAEERQKCTFHPCGAEAFGRSPAKQKTTVGQQHLNSLAVSTESSFAAAQTPPRNTDPSASSPLSATGEAKRRSVSTGAQAQEEGAAFERLYRNAEQTERRERRLRELREAQEEEFRHVCTFHPSLRPPSAGRRRSESNRNPSEEVNRNSPEEGEIKKGASTNRSGTSPRGGQRRSWEHFLADQEERQATHKRLLEDLKKRAAELEHAKLFTGVPRSKASEHLMTYLEKKKGYKGPVEGWSERFEHYMKVKQAEEIEPSTKSASAAAKKKETARTPGSGRTHSRACSESAAAASGRSQSVFHRLYHDSDEREAMRELIRLMKEQHEQNTFFKPNADTAGNGSSNNKSSTACTPRRSHLLPIHVDAAQETAAAVAVAAGEGKQPDGAADAQRLYGNDDNNNRAVVQSIFDALYAEKEKLQQRREMRHLQAQNNAEVYSFHPQLSLRTRELAKDLARQKARGERVETVRERRARAAAAAAAQEAARRAQVRFRYDKFAYRQAERDRKREDELLHLLLRERGEVVEECRFRPTISEVTEAIVEGNKNYTQVIDDPQIFHSLLGQRTAASSSASPAASKSPARDASAHASKSAARQSAAVPLATEIERSVDPAHARPLLTPVQALAAGADEVGQNTELGTSQFYDVFSAPVNTFSATSSNTSEAGFRRIEHQGKTHSQLPMEVSFSSAKDSAKGNVSRSSAKLGDVEGGNLDTVHIAGAASSEYLRQLESELQDALKDWSQCI